MTDCNEKTSIIGSSVFVLILAVISPLFAVEFIRVNSRISAVNSNAINFPQPNGGFGVGFSEKS